MLAKSRKYLFDTLEVFRKYAMKGATAGRRQTKRKKKKYLVIKTFGNKKTGNIYKEGTVFNGDSVPKDITKAMKRDYLMLVT